MRVSQELKNVRVFEAENDLTIGNVTLSAGRLRASRLSKGSVLLAGVGGLVSESAALTFTKNVLSAPAIRAESLAGDIDAKGSALL